MPRTLVVPDRIEIDCKSTLTKIERDAGKVFRVTFDMAGGSTDQDVTTFGKGLMLWAGNYLRTLKKTNNIMWTKCKVEGKVSIKYSTCGVRKVRAEQVKPIEDLGAHVAAGTLSVADAAKQIQAAADKMKKAAAELDAEEEAEAEEEEAAE